MSTQRTEEKWISIREAQKLLRSPRTGRQPDKACIRRWCRKGVLTHRWVNYGASRMLEVLEHEVLALSFTEGRIERRIRTRDRVEEAEQRAADARQKVRTMETLKRHGLDKYL